MATTHKPNLGLILFSTIFLFFSTAVLPSDAVSKPTTPSIPYAPSVPPVSPEPQETLSDILERHRLPGGLFPDSVINYTLSVDGHLSVQLEKPCFLNLEYTIQYDRTFTGLLSYGSILGVHGMQIHKFFWIWSKVSEIIVDLRQSDNIYFKVGDIEYNKFDIHHFKIVNTCQEKFSHTASRFRFFKQALQLLAS